MSRLIDADHLKETLDYYIREGGWGNEANTVLGWVKDEFIDAESPVDAIPTEWIREQMCEYPGMESAMWSKLLRIWKREADT